MSDRSVVKVGAHVSVVCYATREGRERIVVRAIVRRIASEATAGVNIYLGDRPTWRKGYARSMQSNTSSKTGWIYMDEESRWWARGWNSDAARALKAYVALS